jgi:hypothetical protein
LSLPRAPCAECSALGKGALCREPNFAECGTRQIFLCRVPDKRHSAKNATLGKACDSGSDQRMPPKPPDWRSWSSKDARATHASRGSHRQRRPRLARSRSDPRPSWPLPPLLTPIVPYATVVATGPGVRPHHLSASGAPSPLACPPRERRRRSFLVERRLSRPPQGGTVAGP